MGKMRTPPEAPRGGKNIPRLAGGQVCQVLAPAPTRMVLGCPDSSSALNTWLGYLHWGRSQRRAELYPGDLHWVTESSPQTLLLCRGAILIGGALLSGSRLFSLPGMFSSNCLCLPGQSLIPRDSVWGHLFQKVFLD